VNLFCLLDQRLPDSPQVACEIVSAPQTAPFNRSTPKQIHRRVALASASQITTNSSSTLQSF